MLAKKKEIVEDEDSNKHEQNFTLRRQQKTNLIVTENDYKAEVLPTLSDDEIKVFVKNVLKYNNGSETKSIADKANKQRKYSKYVFEINNNLKMYDKLKLEPDETIEMRKNAIFRFVLQSVSDKIGPLNKEENYLVCVTMLKRYVNNDDSLCRMIMNALMKDVKKMTFYRRNRQFILKAMSIFFSAAWKVI